MCEELGPGITGKQTLGVFKHGVEGIMGDQVCFCSEEEGSLEDELEDEIDHPANPIGLVCLPAGVTEQ